MLINKLETRNADNLSKTLGALSNKAAVSGYLVGLMQDAARCVETNLKDRSDNDAGDIKVINEVVSFLQSAEADLSIIMTSDICKATKE